MRILFVISTLLLFVAHSDNKGKHNFTVTVSADSVLCSTPQYIYMYYFRGNECHMEDSALISSNNNTVSLKGYVTEQENVSLLFEKRGPNCVDLIVSPNNNIRINIGEEDVIPVVCKKVVGSPATNERAEDFNRRTLLIAKRLALLEQMQVWKSDSIQAQIREEYEKNESIIRKDEVESLKNTQQPYIAWIKAITLNANDYGIDSVRKMKDEVIKRFPNYKRMETLQPDRKATPPGSNKSRKIHARIMQIKEQKRILIKKDIEKRLISKDTSKEELNINGRYAFWNITVNDTNNVPAVLPVTTRKFQFIDFWGTWCIPCIHELLFLNQLQIKYKECLSIYTISLDKDKKRWKKFIQTLDLDNLKHFSAIDKSGYLYKNIERLNITIVPSNYLLSPDGEILFIDIPRNQLVHTLDSIMGTHLFKPIIK